MKQVFPVTTGTKLEFPPEFPKRAKDTLNKEGLGKYLPGSTELDEHSLSADAKPLVHLYYLTGLSQGAFYVK